MIYGVRWLFRFGHIDGLVPADPAACARLLKVRRLVDVACVDTSAHPLTRLKTRGACAAEVSF